MSDKEMSETIVRMLEGEQLNENFPRIVSTLKTKISEDGIKTVEISENRFPPGHFTDIYEHRISMSKGEEKFEGMEMTLRQLKNFKGQVILGYIETDEKEYFVIFFSGDFKQIVAILHIIPNKGVTL